MKAVKLSAVVDQQRRIVITVPEGFAEGPVELILLGEEATKIVPQRSLAEHLELALSLPARRTPAEIDAALEAERSGWE